MKNEDKFEKYRAIRQLIEEFASELEYGSWDYQLLHYISEKIRDRMIKLEGE